jgi:hypothetical protein
MTTTTRLGWLKSGTQTTRERRTTRMQPVVSGERGEDTIRGERRDGEGLSCTGILHVQRSAAARVLVVVGGDGGVVVPAHTGDATRPDRLHDLVRPRSMTHDRGERPCIYSGQ